MSGLTLVSPVSNPDSGLYATSVKPITSGERQMVVPEQNSGGLLGALDTLGAVGLDGLTRILETAADVKVDELMGGSETSYTTVADPGEVPGGTNQAVSASEGMGAIWQQYKTPVMIGAGLLGLFFAYKAIR